MYHDNDRQMEMIVTGAKAGNENCREELAEMVSKRIWRYFYRITRNEDAMADMVQDTLLKVLIGLNGLRDNRRFWPWVYRIARNRISDYLRTKQRNAEIPFSSIDECRLERVLMDESWRPDRSVQHREATSAVSTAVSKLGSRNRQVVTMRCSGMSYSEIARHLECSETVARVVFLRAKQTICGYLSQMGHHDAMCA